MVVFIGSAALAYADEPVTAPEPAPAAEPARPAQTVLPASPAASVPPTQPVPPAPSAHAQPIALTDTRVEAETPPLSAGRLAGEVFVGSLFLAGGAVGGAVIGDTLWTNREGCGFSPVCLGGLVGAVAGIGLVAPVGVYLIGASGRETGSFGATLAGSAIGTVVGLGAIAIDDENAAMAIPLLVAPIVGAMIGFNATRRYESAPQASSVVPVASVTDGRSMVGVMGQF